MDENKELDPNAGKGNEQAQDGAQAHADAQEAAELANAKDQADKAPVAEQKANDVPSGDQVGVTEAAKAVPVECLFELVSDKHASTNVYGTQARTIGGARIQYNITNKSQDRLLASLKFQDGPIKEAGVNGVMIEDLLTIVIDRLKGFQAGPYACKENAVALSKVELALIILNDRTKEREARGVEGTHK